MKPRILVTRPEPGASRTAARLAAAGFEPVLLPLTRIVPFDFSMPDGDFDAVIVTSAQALKAVKADRILTLTVYAVGETTAESVKSAGFAAIFTAGGSVASIASLVRDSAKPAARLLYLCGKVRRPELETALEAAGFHVTAVETYDAVPISYTRDALGERLGQTPFDAVTLLSAQAAELISAIAAAPKFAPLFQSSVIICFSARICAALRGAAGLDICVTKEATEDAMMACLSRRFF